MNFHFAEKSRKLTTVLFAIALSLTPLRGIAKPKKKPVRRQDEIDVIAKVPIAGSPITRLLTTKHWGQFYLYAEHASQGSLTLIDTTDASHPQMLSDISIPGQGPGLILTATGDAALVGSQATPGLIASNPPQTLTIVNVADRQSPTIVQQIAGVTAMTTDDSRGLIFVANKDGLWVLHRNPAPDPAIEEYFDHYVLGDH
jgi:hypothetical protein